MIDKLEFFIALAKAKHFGHVAQRHGLTRPTLSAFLDQARTVYRASQKR